MRRFELSEGTSNKFWQFAIDGAELHIAWGRIGTAGQAQTKAFGSASAASAAADKLVAEKTKKGYAEVPADGAAPEATKSKPAVASPSPAVASPSASPAPKPAARAPSAVAAPPAEPATAATPTGAPVLEERVVPFDEPSWQVTPPELPSEAEALASFAKSFAEIRWDVHTKASDLRNGLSHVSGPFRAYAERILATYAAGEAPKTLDADADAAFAISADLASMPYLLVRGGLAFVVRVLVASASISHRSVGGQGGSYSYFEAVTPSLTETLWPLSMADWVRPYLPRLAAADLAAGRAEAEKSRGGSLLVRLALASAFGDAAWMAEDAEALLALKKSDYHYSIPRCVFEVLRAPDVVNRFAVRHPGHVPVDRLLSEIGLAALPAALERFDRNDAYVAEQLAHAETVAVAKVLAEALTNKRAAEPAKAFYERRPDLAIVALAPIVARGDKLAPHAKAVLEAVVRKHPALPATLSGHLDAKARALFAKSPASAAPEASASEIPAVLSSPLPPPKRGKVLTVPAFIDLAALPKLQLRNQKALPAAPTEVALSILQRSTLEAPHEALDALVAACDPASLAAFAWAIFEAWLASGTGSKEGWAFTALGLVGDDEAARRLTPMIRAWPGESQHARAGVGLDVLAGIGTDLALMNLNGIAEKVKFKGLQEKAREKVAAIAAARGLTPEELADRLVPDLGLGDGTLTLDFGARAFAITFDEALKPSVRDASGKVLSDLPKPGKSDDAAKAAEAVERFKTLKKDARAVAQTQITRLELAMCNARRWKAADFTAFILRHPLLVHLARRVVWGVYSGAALQRTFRVAEDGTLASEADEPVTLHEGDFVGMVHRLDLAAPLLAAWGKVLSDYEILQPFEQLGREVYAPTSEEKKASSLVRAKGVSAKTGRLLGLEHKGWRKGAPQDAGWVYDMSKALPFGFEATIELGGGFCMGAPDMNPSTQEIKGLSLAKAGGAKATFAELSPMAFSELVRDIESLRD